ncbi:hypothetical protein Pedsa_1367 [Pseudopedobacter saltans DSM 12145]|uniref:DUF3037 domain-containing protein n=1 Tax=Pseudopedobacter saltans (strain ATCC 51119 / DSM 12145 / JCM 21818 / CCUG 39354 / LMG 10337 / NBRC 100064 / NCIMB 13643) TaxID=762903 RepID=F0SEP3_PSESL|nr:DUF3037 domain-containing protein [Pseudopedobacter saltans]ADY51933.1 hypothetical protein Pedsa_1367 [Pseudopedobacter saltans DSM 12145]
MQDKHLFDYAIIRVVPRVEREEFLNVGVIIYCPKKKSLHIDIQLNEERLKALHPTIDIDEIKQHLNAFKKISIGGKSGGPIGELDAPSRFRWLTAKRSTIIQTSGVHPAFCDDLEDKLKEIIDEQVS